MKTSERLLHATLDIWEKYYEHPFLKGIENGTLNPKNFRYYMIQDYIYLQDYIKICAVGIAKAKSPKITQLFSRYITFLTGSEMDIHKGYMGKLKITHEELSATPRALDSLSYTSYMLRVAYEESEVEILTAILSCAVSYEYIARKIVENNPSSIHHELYGEWVKGYASEDCSNENQSLLDMLDALTAHYTDQQLHHLIDIFVTCSRYELAFWEMSWYMRQ